MLQVNYTSKTNKHIRRKRDQICGCREVGSGVVEGIGEEELDEGGQKVQTSRYRIRKFTRDVTGNMKNTINTAVDYINI